MFHYGIRDLACADAQDALRFPIAITISSRQVKA